MVVHKISRFHGIQLCAEIIKCGNLTGRKNDNNEVGLEENTIPYHLRSKGTPYLRN